MTTTPTPPVATTTLTDELKTLAREFSEYADRMPTFTEADEWQTRAGQLRLIAHLTDGASPDPHYVKIGRDFLEAGRKLLAATIDLEVTR